jgi:hypothetical protein
MVSGVRQDTQQGRRTTVKKKVPVVNVADVETANLAGLALEATVALADLAGAVKEGCSACAPMSG